MKIIPLSEGAFTVDSSKVFIPFNKISDDIRQRATGSLLVEIQPFLVITENDKILFDTGLGFINPEGTMQIHQNLLDNGIDPSEVTKVLISHLHKDHANGIFKTVDDNIELSFPGATYYINEKELGYAMEKNNTSYRNENFHLLRTHKNVELLSDKGTIEGGIEFEMSNAHSLYHTVFWIHENNETIFFGGDVAPQLQQMKNRFIAKYDYDGKKSMELRMEWGRLAKEKHWTLLFYHDIRSPYSTM